MDTSPPARLKKELGLFDIYAICTGAMFSSGFFLLPGLAAAHAGPSVILAYFFAGLLILPAMFSQAELATAMPRAGGAYFFLDRALGPLVGTVGGLGVYFALVLKTGFALLGIGVYLAVYVDVPVRPVALVLVGLFAVLNVVGAKEATWLQNALVVILLGLLGVFIVSGFGVVATDPTTTPVAERLTPFLPHGLEGLVATIGLVFVSYAGLTKIASVAEEVKDPERNIPLGMILSLVTTGIVYVLGVALVVITIPAEQLHTDLTPLATAAGMIFSGTLGKLAVAAMVIAAIAAFASTGNAGLLASSRYPLAMARDQLVPGPIGKISRLGTPVTAILITSGLMGIAILFLTEGNIAKLASAFQLVVFALLCVAVIAMRESRISAYDPGFKSPFYPWMQIAGIVVSVVLLAAMNEMVLTLLGLAIVGAVSWYLLYVRRRVVREGALLHWFAQLGQRRFDGIEIELRQIMKEKGLRAVDDVTRLFDDAIVLDLKPEEAPDFPTVAHRVANELARCFDLPADQLEAQFAGGVGLGITPVGNGIGLPHARLPGLTHTHLAAVRVLSGVQLGEDEDAETVKSLFFVVSPAEDARQHLRVLGHIAVTVESPAFMAGWLEARNAQGLHELLFHDSHYRAVRVDRDGPFAAWVGRSVGELDLPPTVSLRFVRRQGAVRLPGDPLRLEPGDVLLLQVDEGVGDDWQTSLAPGE